MHQDSNGNRYENIGNIRITYKEKERNQSDVLSFRAYKNAETDSLHLGAELILEGKETILELIEILCKLYRNKK